MRTSPHNLLQLPLVQPVERRKKAQEKEEENEEEALGRMEKKEGHRQLIPKVSLLQKIAECFFKKKRRKLYELLFHTLRGFQTNLLWPCRKKYDRMLITNLEKMCNVCFFFSKITMQLVACAQSGGSERIYLSVRAWLSLFVWRASACNTASSTVSSSSSSFLPFFNLGSSRYLQRVREL